MTVLEAVAILLAGVGAGTVNAVVGSGTLITFPVLLAFGYAPVTANVSNTIGLVPGAVSGAVGYRRLLVRQRPAMMTLGVASVAGGSLGAVLLLTLPASWFKAIVPPFILMALILIVLQPRLSAALARRNREPPAHGGAIARVAVFVSGVYGGYFGAAQGIMLLAILGLTTREHDLQRINALKVVLALLVNLVAGIIFVFAAHVAWGAAVLIAVGSIIGGQVGARYGQRLSPSTYRIIIVLVGIVAIWRLLAA